jgi:hypothetical protein
MLRNFGCYPVSICRAPEPDPENKGGGGGAPENGGFTEEQLKVFSNVANQVMTAHLKRQPALADQLKDFKWEDVLAPVIQKLAPTPEPKPEPGTKKPELNEYEKQLAKLTNDFQTESKARLDAENRAKASEIARRNDAGRLKLRNALTGHVNDGALEHVINHLTLVSNRLVVDEDGSTKLKVKRPEFPGAPPIEMEVGVDDAIKDILSEADMKIFIPAPKNAGGSNPGPGSKGYKSSQFTGEATSDQEKALRAQVRAEEMAAKYGWRN